jgi:hypothetical protein
VVVSSSFIGTIARRGWWLARQSQQEVEYRYSQTAAGIASGIGRSVLPLLVSMLLQVLLVLQPARLEQQQQLLRAEAVQQVLTGPASRQQRHQHFQ